MKRILPAIVFTLLCNWGVGQELQFRTYLGLTYYQGDLTPQSHSLSISKGQLSYGLLFGGQISRNFFIGGRFFKGNIAGDDALSRDVDRRQRNLNFESNIYELGLVVEYSINSIWKKLDEFGIRLYLSGGVNAFHFNPMTSYRGELISLHRFRTEAQGSFSYLEQDRYQLSQINIPFGGGIQFSLSKNFLFGLEVTTRLTFTDYLDDVSTIYINYDDLLAEFGPITAKLSNRTGEFLGTDPVQVSTGTPRGNPENNDWYFFTGISISYIFGERYP